jgi:predicted enzyme related to lactoylglutathione lyase
MVYFGCEDCAVEAGRVAQAGGQVMKEKFSIGPYGFIAIAADPEGNVFGLHSMK